MHCKPHVFDMQLLALFKVHCWGLWDQGADSTVYRSHLLTGRPSHRHKDGIHHEQYAS
jgi:hypothetical protein